MIHWKRRKKIQDALEAEKNHPRGKVVLSDRRIASLLSYVKKHFREAPENKVKLPASVMASAAIGIIGGAAGVRSKAHFSSEQGLQEYVKKNKNQIFTKYLLDRLAERCMTVKDLYKLTYLNRSIRTKILQSSDLNPYKPDKDTVLKMGIAMQMTLDEMDKFLETAGFALTYNDEKDIVIRYCIDRKIFNCVEVDAMVYKMTGKSLYKERA